MTEFSMTKKTNLVIIVADYPHGAGEPFLEDEIKILEINFKKIYLLHTNTGERINAEYELYTPKNAKIVNLYAVKLKTSWFRKIIQACSFRFVYELFLAKFKHKRPFSISLVKLISHYWITSDLGKKAIIQFLDEENILSEETVFYSYWCDIHAISLAKMKKSNPKMRFITRLHGWDLYFERHEINFLPFREFIFNKAEKIIPISNDGRKYILNHKLSIRPEKIITSRLGVDDFKINVRYRDQYEFDNDSKVLTILTLSHINPVKRLDRLVEVLKEMKEFNIVWHHIGYGHEPYESSCINHIHSELGNNENLSVKLHGQLTKIQVKEFLENTPIDVIVNCSDTEGIPVSIMEAISAGIPAIAYDIGGIPGIISNGENGILLQFDNENNVINLRNALTEFYHFTRNEKVLFSKAAKLFWRQNFNKELNFSALVDLIKAPAFEIKSVISCKQCLIDSTIYPNIVLDKYGICDVCSIVQEKNIKIQNQRDNNYLAGLLKEIIVNKRSKKYDCILGISGGVDSAYLALKAKEWGLNPLLVHIDNGWNSETAVYNIQTLIKQLDFDLYTVVIDWEEIKDLVRSFLKASVIDIDWANEMCAQAALNQVARKFGVKHILTGHQMATEGWMPDNVVHYKLDAINFRAIHRKFGSRKLKTYPVIGFLKTYFYEKFLGIRYYYPLDYIEYNKEKVKEELVEKYGWRDYGQKHFESIFTRFYQGHILIKKFKIDKRRFHYSSSILSGQLTKEQAVELISSDEYRLSGQLEQDKEYIIKKLEFTPEEFEEILNAEPKNHGDYPSIINWIKKLKSIKNVLQNNK
jgi:N-acetyl sugar amidotransferase